MLESLPESILFDSAKSLASVALSYAIRVHECGLKIQTMNDQLKVDKVPSTIRYHETFMPTYKKPNKESWQLEFDKLQEKGKDILFETEKRLVNEVFIPTKEKDQEMLFTEHQDVVIGKLMDLSLVYSHYSTNVERFRARQSHNQQNVKNLDTVEIAQRAVTKYFESDMNIYAYLGIKNCSDLTPIFKQYSSVDEDKVIFNPKSSDPLTPPSSPPPQDTTTNDANAIDIDMEDDEDDNEDVIREKEKEENRKLKSIVITSLITDFFTTYLQVNESLSRFGTSTTSERSYKSLCKKA